MTKPVAVAISPDVTILSPCTNVCRIDRKSGWCEGCRRSVDEITRWSLASDAEKIAILGALPQRTVRKRLGVRW